MSFGFFRTVWISLRAVNYTQQAFNQATTGLTDLQKKQLDFKMTTQKNIFAVGTMYVAFGGMAAMALSRVITSSEYGKKVIENFGGSAGKSIAKIGEAMARILEPFLNIISKFLELTTANPILTQLIAILLLLGTALLIVKGASMMASAAIGILKLQHLAAALATHNHQTSLMAYTGQTQAATGATLSLGMALGIVTAGFTVFLMLGSLFGPKVGAIVAGISAITLAVLALATAMNILSVGMLTPAQLGAAAVGAGLATGVMAMQAGTFHSGTRSAPKTGLALIKQGEIVYDPSTDRPMGVSRTISSNLGGAGDSSTVQKIDVRIDNVHTKADVDDMGEKLGRIFYRGMRSRR